MEPSPELGAVIRRLMGALCGGDAESLRTLASRQPGALWVGSDPDEWWGDPSHAVEVMAIQCEELGGGYPFEVDHVEAHEEGSVGWASVRVRAALDSGQVPIRMTFVCHLEASQWRVVQSHWSIGVPNESVLGYALTTSIEAMARQVESERPDLSRAMSAEGTITLLFTDMVDSSARNVEMGDREWMDLLRAHNQLVRDQVAANGGFEVKSQGDGFMIAFSSARLALRCALGVQRAVGDSGLGIQVRAGLHTGEVVKEADDFFGYAVNLAARIASAARGGEVLAAEVVQRLCGPAGEFSFGPPRQVDLKGFPHERQAYPVGSAP
ncbi:MAG TPA: adenylate/guanylate cyclase domain-containing protein [Acidimicrobiales bacterium]|nr:adenylate/guanylate cyclase domain-containing protein [Acidimicrobiales bacterium]